MIVAWETQERPCRVFEWDLGWCQLAGVCMAGAGWRASVRACELDECVWAGEKVGWGAFLGNPFLKSEVGLEVQGYPRATVPYK